MCACVCVYARQGRIYCLFTSEIVSKAYSDSTQWWNVPVQKMFKYELHCFPPSISHHGELNPPNDKSALIHEIVTPCHNVPDDPQQFEPTSMVIIDGGRLCNQFPPKANMTFDQYAEMLSKGPLGPYFHFNQRIDLVFDTYLEDSLKAKQTQGVRRRVAGNNKCPGNWTQFLRNTTNKHELYTFLAQKLLTFTYPTGRQLFSTCGERVLSNCVTSMEDSDYEQADSRMMVHVQHGLSQGMNRVKILSNDTDVVIIALGVYHTLRSRYIFEDIVIEFGTKKEHQTISLKSLALSLGESRSHALPLLHALTGSDTTSAFKSIGKKKAYEALRAYPSAETTLAHFHFHPFQELNEEDAKFKIIQRLVILMYSRSSSDMEVNQARMNLYATRKHIERIPPTSNSLLFHVRRSIYQCGIWSKCLLAHQSRPSPQNYGWQKAIGPDAKWNPLWMTEKEASKECREWLVKCGCKKSCNKSCTCKAASLKCTLFCSCQCKEKVTYE